MDVQKNDVQHLNHSSLPVSNTYPHFNAAAVIDALIIHNNNIVTVQRKSVYWETGYIIYKLLQNECTTTAEEYYWESTISLG